jgi:peptidyl-prolyl cis-trans isomerase C
VIQTEEVRTAPPPTFEQVHDEIRQSLIQEGVTRVLASAKTGLPIEKFNPDGSPMTASSGPASSPTTAPTAPAPGK